MADSILDRIIDKLDTDEARADMFEVGVVRLWPVVFSGLGLRLEAPRSRGLRLGLGLEGYGLGLRLEAPRNSGLGLGLGLEGYGLGLRLEAPRNCSWS